MQPLSRLFQGGLLRKTVAALVCLCRQWVIFALSDPQLLHAATQLWLSSIPKVINRVHRRHVTVAATPPSHWATSNRWGRLHSGRSCEREGRSASLASPVTFCFWIQMMAVEHGLLQSAMTWIIYCNQHLLLGSHIISDSQSYRRDIC